MRGIPINRNGDPRVCMVVGCERVALYIRANARQSACVRGYCSQHKALAADTTRTLDAQLEFLAKPGK
jgi:hypothetical protein